MSMMPIIKVENLTKKFNCFDPLNQQDQVRKSFGIVFQDSSLDEELNQKYQGRKCQGSIGQPILFLVTLLFGFRPQNFTIFPVAIGLMFLIALLYTTLGTAIASLMEDFHGFQLIMNFLVMPTFFLSGALFPLASAPPILKSISKINPLTYEVDGLREVLTGTVQLGLALDVVILALLSVILLSISSYLFSKIEA